MSGKVYVFNVNLEPMDTLQVRNFDAGKIGGWSTESNSKYTPQSLGIERTKNRDDIPSFAQGENEVFFRRATYNGRASITVPQEISLLDDLILYLTRNTAILMRTSGEVISTVNFDPELLAES